MVAISQTTRSKAIFNENVRISIVISLKIVSRVQLKYHSVGSDNGLVLIRRQAIIWSNDELFPDAYVRHLASMS